MKNGNNLALASVENGQYAVITPMRNEIRTIQHTMNALISQSCLPVKWLILDDGSTDGSGELVERYAEEYPWIVHIKLQDRGYDFVGKGVANLLNHGLDILVKNGDAVQFVAKLDADMDFESDYFSKLISDFISDPSLGIVSGHPYVEKNNKRIFERHSDYFPSGTARLYRAKYLNEIGYFASSVGWDTVDILRMRIRGYDTRVRHDIPIHHMRRMGTRQGYIDGMVRDGRNNYMTGYSPWFFILRAMYNARYYPYVLRTICMIYGYFKSYFNDLPKAVSDEEYAFHVQMQKNRIFGKGLK